jgi:hypothetical protein
LFFWLSRSIKKEYVHPHTDEQQDEEDTKRDDECSFHDS